MAPVSAARDRSGAPFVRRKQIQRLIDGLPALIAYWDAELCNRVANAAYLEYFGLAPDQMRGMHISQVLGPDLYRRNEPFLVAALAGEEQLFERTLIDMAGRELHTQSSYVPDVVDGQVRGIFVLVTDVTPRVEAQRDLDEAQELASLGSWSQHRPEGAVAWSRQMYRLVGQDPATFRPSHEAYRMFIHPDDIERVRRVQDEKLWSGEDFDLHYRLVVEGEVRNVASRTRPVLDSFARPVLRGTVQDETRVHRQAANLATTNRLLTNMVAMVGHDVRQPVSLVLGNLEQALDTWPQDSLPEQRTVVERAYAASQRLSELVHAILTMVSLDTGELVVNPEVVDVASLVAEVAQTVSTDQLRVTTPDSALARVDPFHLRQALANLIINAESYGRAPVGVEVACESGQVRINVTDEGEGVPPDFVPQLFERFSRAKTGVASRRGGTGLGLFIVKELMEANGGSVAYASNSPAGATFTLVVPAAPSSWSDHEDGTGS